jgi:metal-responsive CopG/Arc/MetJ family transcriptional regulator
MQNKSGLNGRADSDLNTARINLTLAKVLLERVDAAAQRDYTTRSEFIRQALLDYLRVPGLKSEQLDPNEVLKTLKRRQAIAASNKMLKQNELSDE